MLSDENFTQHAKCYPAFDWATGMSIFIAVNI